MSLTVICARNFRSCGLINCEKNRDKMSKFMPSEIGNNSDRQRIYFIYLLHKLTETGAIYKKY